MGIMAVRLSVFTVSVYYCMTLTQVRRDCKNVLWDANGSIRLGQQKQSKSLVGRGGVGLRRYCQSKSAYRLGSQRLSSLTSNNTYIFWLGF